jgi:hypothetical protein
MKVSHGVEVGGQSFAVSSFQLLDEKLDVLADDPLRGDGLPIFTVGSWVGNETAAEPMRLWLVLIANSIFSPLAARWGVFSSPGSEAGKKRTTGQSKRNDQGEGAGARGKRGK